MSRSLKSPGCGCADDLAYVYAFHWLIAVTSTRRWRLAGPMSCVSPLISVQASTATSPKALQRPLCNE